MAEAKRLCPSLIAQHVATWREGDDNWAYREDAAANIATDKVSLDPYRLQSRRILALIKEHLPAGLQKVEKASIDEVFLDLSAHIHSELLTRYPELANPPPYDDPNERLPLPSVAALDWQTDALVDLDEEQEAVDPDWDDVAILIGSEIVRDIRAKVSDQLRYTCSAGIAHNKLVSKLGSGFKKPNRQTVIRGRAVQAFLDGFKLTKFRNLGGKLGDQIVTVFKTDNVRELCGITVEQMKQKLGEETGLWVYNTIRGSDLSEVNARTQIKSMLSAKSFRPTIKGPEQAKRWLRIFSADIYARLVEEGVVENRRRPRSIILHHRYGGQSQGRQESRSRGEAIPSGRKLDEELLFRLATELLSQLDSEPRIWPCANLSLSVSGFEEGVKGNMGIGSFLVKGEEAEFLRRSHTESRPSPAETDIGKKKRRIDDGGIRRFFGQSLAGAESSPKMLPRGLCKYEDVPADEATVHEDLNSGLDRADVNDDGSESTIFTCTKCHLSFKEAVELQSHTDWHMAKDLQDEERLCHPTTASTQSNEPPNPSRGFASTSRVRRGRGRGRGAQSSHGQKKLTFR